MSRGAGHRGAGLIHSLVRRAIGPPDCQGRFYFWACPSLPSRRRRFPKGRAPILRPATTPPSPGVFFSRSRPRVVRRRPAPTPPSPAPRTPHPPRDREHWRQHVEAVPLGEIPRLHHHSVRALVTAQPGVFAQALQHGQVSLAPGVIFRCRVPIHAGNRAALRRTWKAARAGGARLSFHQYLDCAIKLAIRMV
jgi:hypothetical protein